MKGGRALGHSASTPGPGACASPSCATFHVVELARYSALEARDEVKRASPKYGFGTSPREARVAARETPLVDKLKRI
eukprot:3296336-Amphidinium_carterae.1